MLDYCSLQQHLPVVWDELPGNRVVVRGNNVVDNEPEHLQVYQKVEDHVSSPVAMLLPSSLPRITDSPTAPQIQGAEGILHQKAILHWEMLPSLALKEKYLYEHQMSHYDSADCHLVPVGQGVLLEELCNRTIFIVAFSRVWPP